MAEFRPDKPVEEEERTEDDDHAKTTEEEVQTEEGDQAKTNEEVSITMQIPRRNGQTMNQQEQLPRASSSTQVKLSYSAIVSRLATSSSSSAINEPKKKTPSSILSGSAASSSSAINEASKKTERTSSSTVSGLADSSCSAINEPNKKTQSSSSSRNGKSSGTVEIKREHVTQKTMNLGSTSCATEQSQTENPQEDSSTVNPELCDVVIAKNHKL